jgi:hypothetical protein
VADFLILALEGTSPAFRDVSLSSLSFYFNSYSYCDTLLLLYYAEQYGADSPFASTSSPKYYSVAFVSKDGDVTKARNGIGTGFLADMLRCVSRHHLESQSVLHPDNSAVTHAVHLPPCIAEVTSSLIFLRRSNQED